MSAVGLTAPVPSPLAAGAAATAATPSRTDDGFSFGDLLDIVNPLQHIPVVSTLYRAITGDHIKTFPKIAGDALYGGVTGFIASVADTIFEKITGKNVGDTVLAWVEDELAPGDGGTSVATVTSPPPASPVQAHRSFGERALAWLEDLVSPSAPATALASAPAPAAGAPATVAPAALDTIVVPGQDALLLSMTRKNIDQDLALRAASAYRSTIDVSGKAAAHALH